MGVICRRHPIPGGMVSALRRNGSKLWVGLSGHADPLWRFDIVQQRFESVPGAACMRGRGWIHRAILDAPDGSLVVAVASALTRTTPGDGPRSAKALFLSMRLTRSVLRWVTSTRVYRRDVSGEWSYMGRFRTIATDIAWDAHRSAPVLMTSGGLLELHADGSAVALGSIGGFVHQLVVGPEGQLVTADARGHLWLHDSGGAHDLGSLGDDGGGAAIPGIDGLVAVGNVVVGLTRNRARPFIVDLVRRSLTLLDPTEDRPRGSAICRTPRGRVLFCTGVGRVGLYELDLATATTRRLGTVPCHHLHDLVAVGEHRLFGGEFYPLDVVDPPWPQGPCGLWEISLESS